MDVQKIYQSEKPLCVHEYRQWFWRKLSDPFSVENGVEQVDLDDTAHFKTDSS